MNVQYKVPIMENKVQHFRSSIGFHNSRAHCYLNSILQAIFLFEEFRAKLIDYFLNQTSKCVDLAYALGKLFYSMEYEDHPQIQGNVRCVHSYFESSSRGDDIYKCYLNILSQIKKELKYQTSELKQNEVNKSDSDTFNEWFYGKLSFKIQCDNCKSITKETTQRCSSLALPVPINKTVKLKRCLKEFLSKSLIVGEKSLCCSDPKLYNYTEIQDLPKYLFIYLVRGNYLSDGPKNETHVEFKDKINISVAGCDLTYQLKSVIDHIGDNTSGHYFVKVLQKSSWYLKNDLKVREIQFSKVITKNAIGIFFERQYAPDPRAINLELVTDNLPLDSATKWIWHIFLSIEEFKEKVLKLCSFLKKLPKVSNEDQMLILKLGSIIERSDIENKKLEIEIAQLPHIFPAIIIKNNISRSYLQILESLSKVEQSFIEEMSDGINDPFMGSIIYASKCEKCQKIFSQDFQIFRSISLDIKNKGSLQSSINQFLKNSEFFEKKICCDGSIIVCEKHIKHAPKYLLIDLFQNKESLFENTDVIITLNSETFVKYRIIYVIDCVNENQYSLKRISKDKCYLQSENECSEILSNQVFTKNTVSIFLEMKSSKEYRTNTLYYSIIQMMFFCEELQQTLIDFFNNNKDVPNKSEIAAIGEIFEHLLNEDVTQTRTKMRDLKNLVPIVSHDAFSCYNNIFKKINTFIHPNVQLVNHEKQMPYNINNLLDFKENDIFQRCHENGNFLIDTISFSITLNKNSSHRCERNFMTIENDPNTCYTQPMRRPLAPKNLFFFLKGAKFSWTLEKEIILPACSVMERYLLKLILCRKENVNGEKYYVIIRDGSFKLYNDFEYHEISEEDIVSNEIVGFMMELDKSFKDSSIKSNDNLSNDLFGQNMTIDMGKDVLESMDACSPPQNESIVNTDHLTNLEMECDVD